MAEAKIKRCKRCGELKLDDFANFGRTGFGTTTTMCLPCTELDLARRRQRVEPRQVPPPTKPCKRCGTVLPNDFANFGKKNAGRKVGDRIVEFATVDVCKRCASASHVARWARQQAEAVEYQRFKQDELMKRALAAKDEDKTG